jgi:large subunit ribosomal protein L1
MAKKAELLEQAKKLKLDVTSKNKVAEIESAINNATESTKPKETIEKPTKAGKHSSRGLKEAEEKQAKISKQLHREDSVESDPKPIKKTVKPTRTRLERRSKNYKKVAEKIDKAKEYPLLDAVNLALQTNPTKFDASVELHVKLGVDPRQADQNIRGTVILPAGTGKKVRVAVFADEDDIKTAKEAGADIAGSDDFLQLLDKQQLDFDVLISTPQMMAKLGKYARVLGPKGLMPNPKSGTVTKNVKSAIKEAKTGKIEYRVDSYGIMHLSVGKTSFSLKDLEGNINTVVQAIKNAKPASVKGSYLQSMFITTTMGPSIKVAIN